MNIIDLGGNSGCQILLIDQGKGFNFVRKISKDENYNFRLRAQCEKQIQFKNGQIKAPKVLKTGTTSDGLFFFDMEYIQGITLAEYVRSIEIGKIRGLVETLVQIIDFEGTGVPNDVNSFFSNKISKLSAKLSGRDAVIDDAINILVNHDWSKFSPSLCHGDMTLENIIVRNDELFFIDFLDSFYDSYLLDFGTLLQDIQVMWSYREDAQTDMNLVIRLIVFRDLLIDAIRDMGEDLVEEVYFALLLKLVRILPYLEDKVTWKFLIQKIAQINKEVA